MDGKRIPGQSSFESNSKSVSEDREPEDAMFQDMDAAESSSSSQPSASTSSSSQLARASPSAALFRPFDVNERIYGIASSDEHVVVPTSWGFNILPQSFPVINVPQFAPNLTSYLPNLPSNLQMPRMPSIPRFNVPSIPSMPSFSIPSMPSMPSMPSLPSLIGARPTKSWTELREAVRSAHRRLSDVSSKVPFAFNFKTIEKETLDGRKVEGVRIYFLSPLANSAETTLHYCDVYEDGQQGDGLSAANSPIERPNSSISDRGSRASTTSPIEMSGSSERRDSSIPAGYEWRPLIESRFKRLRERGLEMQEKLQLERKRMMLTGITSYEYDQKSSRFVFQCRWEFVFLRR